MNKDTTVSIRGKVTYWTLSSSTDLETLKQGFHSAGVGHLAPDEISPQIALKNALTKVCGGRRRMVRPLSDRQGYAVVSESRKDNSNNGGAASLAHEVDYHAVFTQDGAGISFENPDGTKADAATVVGTMSDVEITYGTEWYVIREKFADELDKCPSHKVAQALVKVVDFLHGIPLRPTGGIYWMPESAKDKWDHVCTAVHNASPNNHIFGLRTAMDEDASTAIHAALIHSIEGEIEKYMDEFRNNPPKRESTYKYRQNRIGQLAARVTGYTNILGKDLSTLQTQLDTLEGARAMAALAAMRKTL